MTTDTNSFQVSQEGLVIETSHQFQTVQMCSFHILPHMIHIVMFRPHFVQTYLIPFTLAGNMLPGDQVDLEMSANILAGLVTYDINFVELPD